MADDIFRRKPVEILRPITADMLLIIWGGSASDEYLTHATQVSIQYNQPMTKRWSLGTNGKNQAAVYPGRPVGQLQIQRLFAEGNGDIFNKPGWNICAGLADITINMKASQSSVSLNGECTQNGGTYILIGGLVTSYGITAEAEGLTVIDNINIEFMQMQYTP